VARTRLVGGVVGITGSVGKTTTKDLVAQCLSTTFVTAASARSLNNELGVPLTLANAPDAAQWVVLEMGARGPGHIAQLVDLGEPSVGVVTRVAMAHIEFFGSLEGVYLAKRELVDGLPPSGVAVLNADDPWVHRMAEGCPCSVLGYGLDPAADIRAEGVQFNQDLQPRFRLVTPWGTEDTSLQLHGSVQVSNALAAAATALWCGASLPDVAAALSDAVGPALRMDVRRPNVGPVLIVDCYNANPASTEAALSALAELGSGHKVALLGVMAELGPDSAAEHARMAEVARSLDITVLGFQTDGYGGDVVSSVSDAVARLAELGSDDAVLIKGSRVARLEDVVQAYGQSIGDGSLV
jgi:UDP-N-acetylmuramoyl-tripeptide--D-alanyl-D-alanine ligase